MAEEQRCGEGHRLCANNCGFFGSSATLGLCSKCYRDHRLKEDHAASAKTAVEKSLRQPGPASVSPTEPSVADEKGKAAAAAEQKEQQQAAGPSRCAACRKRVGLAGFKCRCGATCCGAHRYPEQHGCSFDFRAAGREAIALANPVVKADKLGNKI